MVNEQIILGGLLGDAYIPKIEDGSNHRYCICWQHSHKQKDYAIWKAEQCFGVDNFSIYQYKRYDVRTDQIYSNVTIRNSTIDYIEYRKMFYPEGTKIVNSIILKKLSKLAIAVWFCDDGNIYYNGHNCHLSLSINGFTEVERSLVIDYFKEYWNLNFKPHGKAIRLTSLSEVSKFYNLFGDFIPESMIYKTLNYAKAIHIEKIGDNVKFTKKMYL